MFSITLALWTPAATGFDGLAKWIAWLVWVEGRRSVSMGVYGVRMRLFGFSVAIELFLPTYEKKEPEIHVSATAVSTNGEETSVILGKEQEDWAKKIASMGVSKLLWGRSRYNDADNSFTLDAKMKAVVVDIKDRIVIGDEGDFVMVEVTGSREQEDGSRIFYTKLLNKFAG